MPHGIKKIRECPQDIQSIKALVHDNVKDKDLEHLLWYEDESSDWITIMDNDDL